MRSQRESDEQDSEADDDVEQATDALQEGCALSACTAQRLREIAKYLRLEGPRLHNMLRDSTLDVGGYRVSLVPLQRYGIHSDYDAVLTAPLPNVRADNADMMGRLLNVAMAEMLSTGCTFGRGTDGQVLAMHPISMRQMQGEEIAVLMILVASSAQTMDACIHTAQ